MKFGICIGGVNKQKLTFLKQTGYDYFEISLKRLALLGEEEFCNTVNTVREVGLPCLSANSMLPASYKIASDGFDQKAALDYVAKAFLRAAQLGVSAVVFGSGGARSVAEGVDKNYAYNKVASFLNSAALIAQKHGITIVLEPLSRFECNLINTIEQGAALAEATQSSNVKAHADLFHMYHSQDDISNIMRHKGILAHSHISNPKTRMFPKRAGEADYRSYIEALQYAGCDTCSVEGWAVFFDSAAKKAIKLLKSL